MEKFLGCLRCFTSCQKSSTNYSSSSNKHRVLLALNWTVLLAALSMCLLWLGFWQAMGENDRLNLLEFVYGVTGAWVEWNRILFGLSVAAFVYLAVFVLAIALLIHIPLMRGKPAASLKMHFLYLIFHGVILVFCLGFVGAIQSLYSQVFLINDHARTRDSISHSVGRSARPSRC